MVDVATGHEHALTADVDVLAADCAGRWLQVFAAFVFSEASRCQQLFLAMLFFDLDYWKLGHGVFACLVFLTLGFSLLLADSPHHLEQVCIWIETALKVLHKITRSGTIENLLHS